MSTLVVAFGPGALLVSGDDDGWDAADVEMRYENVAPEMGTDTIAMLQLNAKFEHSAEETRKVSIDIELTRGDVQALFARLERTLLGI